MVPCRSIIEEMFDLFDGSDLSYSYLGIVEARLVSKRGSPLFAIFLAIDAISRCPFPYGFHGLSLHRTSGSSSNLSVEQSNKRDIGSSVHQMV